jgi:DNA-binding response OmpR family regulator
VKNVLITDEDLGFVFWLGQALDAAGYEALPGRGIPEAIALLEYFKVTIDVLIVRFGMPGADAFANDLRSLQDGHLKVIALLDEGDEHTASLSAWDAWQVKPRLPDENARGAFLKLIQDVLAPTAAVPST